jgi:hypothetical protein
MGRCYLSMHETTWESRRLGSAPQKCDFTPGRRPRGTRGCPANEVLTGIGQSLASRGQDQRPRCVSAQARAGEAETSEHQTAHSAAQDDAQGSRGARIFNRPLDVATCRRTHRPNLWSSVPPCPCLESIAWRGMELPETGATSPGEGREGHREVADGELAPYKKTPAGPEGAWSFSMKAASCSNRWFDVPGRHEARRQSFANGIVAIDSRPSAPSRLLRGDDAMVFTGLSILTIFGVERCFGSFKDCGVICRKDLPSFGIGDRCTEQNWSRTGLRGKDGLLSSLCLPTRRISTRWRRSGVTPSIATWRTTLPIIFKNSNKPSSPPWCAPEGKAHCSRHSSEVQD